jgi:DNA polymerase delta subunit 1
MWTKVEKPDKIDTKGIEAVRRDNCPLLQQTMISALKVLAETMDVSKAWQVAVKAFKKLADQTATWEELTVTKTLGEDYTSDKQVQLVVAEYLRKHHPLLAPDVGDRVPFCYIKVPGTV